MRKGKDAEDGTAGRGSPDPPVPAPTPFERFEEFARKVISVPKSVIDKRDREVRHKPNGQDRKRPA